MDRKFPGIGDNLQHLDDKFNVFGQVEEGFDVIEKIIGFVKEKKTTNFCTAERDVWA